MPVPAMHSFPRVSPNSPWQQGHPHVYVLFPVSFTPFAPSGMSGFLVVLSGMIAAAPAGGGANES